METGIYLQPLTKEETLAVMTEDVMEDQIAKGQYMDAMAVTQVGIEHYPLFVQAVVRRGSAAYLLSDQDFKAKYPSIEAVPEAERPLLDYLLRANQEMFDRAEGLGWQPFDPLCTIPPTACISGALSDAQIPAKSLFGHSLRGLYDPGKRDVHPAR
jgi:hypothetical protein